MTKDGEIVNDLGEIRRRSKQGRTSTASTTKAQLYVYAFKFENKLMIILSYIYM